MMSQNTQNETTKMFVAELEKHLATITETVKDLRDKCFDENGNVQILSFTGTIFSLPHYLDEMREIATATYNVARHANKKNVV